MHRQLFDLFHEKAKVEAEIRRIRVITIRKTACHLKASKTEHFVHALHLVDQMNEALTNVVRNYVEFDELLDRIEAYLFDN